VEIFEDPPDYDADEWLKNRLFLAKMQVHLTRYAQLYTILRLCSTVLISDDCNVSLRLAQAVRKLIRSLVNSVFAQPIRNGSSDELKSLLLLITGKTLNAADPGDEILVTIIHIDHPLRRVLSDPGAFVLCPDNAKGKSPVRGLNLAGHKEFFTSILQN
jgi:hypothetical protein